MWPAMYDIGALIMLPLIAVYGERVHKGRCIGLGMLLMAVGTFVCVIPHFVM
jgi:MFS family permease